MSIRWLLIGTGDIVHKRVAAALGQGLVGVCGTKERAAAIASQYGAAEVFDDVDEALRQTSANAVYVSTAVYRHRVEAVKALEAGKHVLVEKPLALDAADAQRIVAAAASTGLKAGCAYYRRCSLRYAHLKDLLAKGTLGQIVQVRTCNWSWFRPAHDDPKYWRVSKAHSGGGPLADIGVHMFDVLIGLFGLPRSVFAYCDTLAHDYEVEDASAVVMRLANGAHVTANFCWNSKSWRHEFEVVGTEGKVLWSPADTGEVILTMAGESEELDLPKFDNVHLPLIEDFEQAIVQDRQPIDPVAEAAKTNVLLDAIFQSAADNAPIDIDP
jgi:predicted dehydrogenase